MEENQKPVILFKVVKDLNVGISKAVEHLKAKGYIIENKPTAKLSPLMHEELIKAFGMMAKDKPWCSSRQKHFTEKIEKIPRQPIYIGKVTKFLDENGYGFVREVMNSTNEFSSIGEVFFHVKNAVSEVFEGSVYAYNIIRSRRHTGKIEAIELIALEDIDQIEALFELNLRYPRHLSLEKVQKVAERLGSDILLTNLRVICQKYVISCDEMSRYQNMKCFYELLDLCVSENLSLKHELSNLIMQSGLKDLDVALIFGNKYLDIDEIEDYYTRLRAIYLNFDANEQLSHLSYLTLSSRTYVYNISQISTESQLQLLISILDVSGEDKQANYLSIKSNLFVDRRCTLLLWIYGFEPVRPELKDLILSLDKSLIIRMLAKFNFVDFVDEFPYNEIRSTAEYEFFSVFMEQAPDKKGLISAYITRGLIFSGTCYLKAVSYGYFKGISLNIDLLMDSVGMGDITGYKELIKNIGWRDSLKIFVYSVQKEQYKSIEFIIKNTLDFSKSDTLELGELIELERSTHMLLWIDGLIDLVDLSSVAYYFLTLKDDEKSEHIYALVKDKKPFISKAFDIFKQQNKANTVQAAIRLLAKLKTFDFRNYNRYVAKIIVASNDNTKLGLWLEDIHNEFDFDRYKPLFITLGRQEQINFLKKSIWLLRQGTIKLTLIELLSLRNLTVNPEIANYLKSPGQINISVFIVLQLLQDLHIGALTKQEKIYQLIAENITDIREMLFIGGFFDKCQGRLEMDFKFEVKADELYPIMEKRSGIPAHLEYCEGRKAKLKNTDTFSICENTGKEFWWCRNRKCYANCINSHDEWQELTILDFCRAFAIPLQQDDYEILLGYINKINRYLKHMNCRTCNCILRPASRNEPSHNSNYGFYRVSNFACMNSECQKYNQIIYLSHCANGSCTGIIDQRDSVKCIPVEAPHANCGWYVCNDCLACCNTQNINKRKYILNKNAQVYHGHHQGHLDLGIICCPKCGHELNRNGENVEKYKEVLSWLIANCNSSKSVVKYGKRQLDNRYWFLLMAEGNSIADKCLFKEKLIRLASYGFKIPDLLLDKSSYMVSEPFMNNEKSLVFECGSCDYSLDLGDDYEKRAIMRNYHKKLQITRQYV
ncbi:hypothetical protein LPB86_15830 [Pedobacter sp. MC2016-14]|uniref:hypothetical protein n=1 Tax=Pedobacter sp. MC2016-14 TaxID=2897327 RepID=UPI001E2CD8FB|nr:hypothetical protein [Pedobacter sp. MC2016-14]MCD0489712.1 hypothetical protein [Pedobacter sp. MC2016-14]